MNVESQSEYIAKWRKALIDRSYKGIEPLRFGMTQEEVIALFGKPDDTSSEKPPLIFKYSDIEFHFDKENDHQLFSVQGGESGELCVQYIPALYDALAAISQKLTDSNEVYCRLFGEGHRVIVAYKENNGTQGNAFNTTYRLFLDNRQAGGELSEYREDLICDWLDCMCGYIGPSAVIWY